MARKKPLSPGEPDPSPNPGRDIPSPQELSEGLDTLSPLQLIDMITQFHPIDSPRRIELGYLRRRIEELEILNDQARQAVEKLDAAVTKLTQPANRVGTLLALPKDRKSVV